SAGSPARAAATSTGSDRRCGRSARSAWWRARAWSLGGRGALLWLVLLHLRLERIEGGGGALLHLGDLVLLVLGELLFHLGQRRLHHVHGVDAPPAVGAARLLVRADAVAVVPVVGDDDALGESLRRGDGHHLRRVPILVGDLLVVARHQRLDDLGELPAHV